MKKITEYLSSMDNVTSLSIFFLAAGILTSVTILSAYQILFGIPLIYYTAVTIKNKQWNLPLSGKFLLAFAAIALLSLTINFDIVPRPSKNFGRVKYFMFGVCGIWVIRAWLQTVTLKTKKVLSDTFLTSIIVAGLATSYQHFFTDTERASSLTETMRYGYGSAMLLATLLSALLHRKQIEWLNPKLGLLAFVIGFLGMYLTYTRGGILGFLCGLPFVLYFYRPRLGIIFGLFSLLVVGTLGGYYFFGKYELGESSRFVMSKDNESDVMRRSQWKAAIIAIQERPLLGWGLSNFHTQLRRIKHVNDLDAKWYDDAHSHNLFLEVGSGTGLFGLMFFLGWLISWATECFKAKGLVRALVVPFGVVFTIASQFEVTFDANNASMIFFLYALTSGSTNVQQI